jgi:CRP-like cAMP-binding protein
VVPFSEQASKPWVCAIWTTLHQETADGFRALVRYRDAGLLFGIGLGQTLTRAAIDSLALHVGYAHVPAGREVFHQSDDGDRFCVIRSGEADVIGDGRFIRTMGPADGFGEIALLRDTVRTTTVRARTPLVLHTLERRDFVFAIRGYQSSARAADALVGDRLGTFTPARGSAA